MAFGKQITAGWRMIGLRVRIHRVASHKQKMLNTTLAPSHVTAKPITPHLNWPTARSAPNEPHGRQAAPSDHPNLMPWKKQVRVPILPTASGNDEAARQLVLRLIAQSNANVELCSLHQSYTGTLAGII